MLKAFRSFPSTFVKNIRQFSSFPFQVKCFDEVEIGDIILDINGYGTYNGHTCFNSDLDQNDDGLIELGDIILVIGQYGNAN